MKSFFLGLLLCTVVTYAFAQWNPNNQTTGNIFYNGGNVGIGTASPYSKLNIMDNGVSINASDVFNGGLIIQSNTGGRSQTIGAQLEFVIPANTDGSNMWGQGRIITVAGNSSSGSAAGKMIFGTRRSWQKPGTPNFAWYYGDDITIDQSGLVGIGTTAPVSKLHVSGDNMITVGDFSSSNGVKGIHFTGWRDNTADYFGASIEAEPVWICCTGYPNGGYAGVKNIALNFNIHNASDWSANAKTTAMRINYDGNVGIGTTNPTEKLTVSGNVYSREVKVDVSAGTGPDYVFEPTYQLPSLTEIESYIKANKHLPEVPSAKEMEANGINLSEMNMLLLKKVEELTLHLIEANKKIEYLTKRIDEKN